MRLPRASLAVTGLLSFGFFALQGALSAAQAIKDPLSYRTVDGSYVPQKPENVTTLLQFIKSRDDLSELAKALHTVAGFEEAFDTNPTWNFTFFAPNNDAFNNTGQYFETFAPTPKGIWWIGNTLIHHYVPNSVLTTDEFDSSYQRFQTGTYLYVGSEKVDDQLILNQVSNTVETDLMVTNGVVHIVDRIIDPTAQLYEADLPKVWMALGSEGLRIGNSDEVNGHFNVANAFGIYCGIGHVIIVIACVCYALEEYPKS